MQPKEILILIMTALIIFSNIDVPTWKKAQIKKAVPVYTFEKDSNNIQTAAMKQADGKFLYVEQQEIANKKYKLNFYIIQPENSIKKVNEYISFFKSNPFFINKTDDGKYLLGAKEQTTHNYHYYTYDFKSNSIKPFKFNVKGNEIFAYNIKDNIFGLIVYSNKLVKNGILCKCNSPIKPVDNIIAYDMKSQKPISVYKLKNEIFDNNIQIQDYIKYDEKSGITIDEDRLSKLNKIKNQDSRSYITSLENGIDIILKPSSLGSDTGKLTAIDKNNEKLIDNNGNILSKYKSNIIIMNQDEIYSYDTNANEKTVILKKNFKDPDTFNAVELNEDKIIVQSETYFIKYIIDKKSKKLCKKLFFKPDTIKNINKFANGNTKDKSKMKFFYSLNGNILVFNNDKNRFEEIVGLNSTSSSSFPNAYVNDESGYVLFESSKVSTVSLELFNFKK